MTDSQRFYRNVCRHLPLSHHKKREYLQPFHNSLQEYLEEHPAASYDDFVRTFGLPEEIAAGVMNQFSNEIQSAIHSHRKNILFFALAVVLLICICIAQYFELIRKYQSQIIYVSTEIIEFDSWPFPEEDSSEADTPDTLADSTF